MRMAAGSDDHPSTPTAMQVYKILSLTHTLMPSPSKYGNCSNDPTKMNLPSVVSLNDIKQLYKKSDNPKHLSPYQFRMKEIRKVISTDELDVFDIDIVSSEHDYDVKSEQQSILYFTAAKIVKRLCETSPVKNCERCKESLRISVKENDENVKAGDVGLEDWELQFQPKQKFCNFIGKLDDIFQKHKKQINAAALVLQDAAEQKILAFPCNMHKEHVIEFVLEFFISMKMLQAARDEIREKKKESMHAKKLAKHKGT